MFTDLRPADVFRAAQRIRGIAKALSRRVEDLVICVLDRHVDPGQIAKVKCALPKHLRQMWDSAEGIAFPERGAELISEPRMKLEAV